MTKEEKKTIYSLLKTASDSLCGYASADFSGSVPDFSDDEARHQDGTKVARAATDTAAESTVANIARKIAECRRCQLCAARTQTVPGTGVENPLALIIGEGPGAEEDRQGIPFVGPAGQLLDKMLAAIQLYRNKNCFIANIVKCRPPMNRNPLPEEADACRPFLDAQIAALRPKAILCAGSVAVKNLLKTQAGVMKLHGQIMSHNGIPVVATWHPSALLRDPSNKRAAWEDLKIFKNVLLSIQPGYDA